MKNRFWVVLIAISCAFAPACKEKSKDKVSKKSGIPASEVPGDVKMSFNVKYPDATEVAWENAHENAVPTFKAKFRLDDRDMKAEFKKDGSLVKESED